MINARNRFLWTLSIFSMCFSLQSLSVSLARCEGITQRGINNYAAALQRARYAVIENTGLRNPGEALVPYLMRISSPLPGESRSKFLARVSKYISAIINASKETEDLKSAPDLIDTDQVNRKAWNHAVRYSLLFPREVVKLKSDWNHVKKKNSIESSRRFQNEFINCIQTDLAEFDILRDVLP